MSLPLKIPYPPMEALPVKEIPTGMHWQYEPKWDGFRCIALKGKVVGSLLLGLYDQSGLLHHVGFTSSFKEEDKAPLTRKLEPLIKPPLALLVTNPVGRVAGVRSEVANGSSRGEVSG